jgi:hypothetical protein
LKGVIQFGKQKVSKHSVYEKYFGNLSNEKERYEYE